MVAERLEDASNTFRPPLFSFCARGHGWNGRHRSGIFRGAYFGDREGDVREPEERDQGYAGELPDLGGNPEGAGHEHRAAHRRDDGQSRRA